MKHIRPHISQHRLERLTTWSRLMLVWFVGAFTGAMKNSRRLRRFGDLTLNALATQVAAIIFHRAVNLLSLYARPQQVVRVFGTRGFKQRTGPKSLIRAAHGSWLRKALRHRDPAARISILLHALAHVDRYVARILPRLKRRLTRISARVIAAPPAHAVRSLADVEACVADSS
ncbi:MAG: hypothetical protein J0L81_08725 [Caulobacterales bacterium]|nr:hypothetical protein [Caulobacterales bacterium]